MVAMVAMSNFFINQVNPKFKEYNRPLFLAIVVFIPTAVLTLMLFFTMVSDCNSQVKVGANIQQILREIKGADCVWNSDYLETNCGYGKCTSEYAACRLITVDYCEGSLKDWYTSAVACPDNGVLSAQIKQCPEAMPTLGAAMGYAGFIELAVTICLVFALTKTGVISGGPKGHMGQMIQEIIKDKNTDTGKEIGDVIGASA